MNVRDRISGPGVARTRASLLYVEISKGSAAIETVLQDIVSVTKLNHNTCMFGDGVSITLKFADAVGEILTAGLITGAPPLPDSYYI